MNASELLKPISLKCFEAKEGKLTLSQQNEVKCFRPSKCSCDVSPLSFSVTERIHLLSLLCALFSKVIPSPSDKIQIGTSQFLHFLFFQWFPDL